MQRGRRSHRSLLQVEIAPARSVVGPDSSLSSLSYRLSTSPLVVVEALVTGEADVMSSSCRRSRHHALQQLAVKSHHHALQQLIVAASWKLMSRQ
jgi:hypothetical protein